MRTITTIIASATLVGCAAFSPFDNVEYGLANSVTTKAEVAKEQCSSDKIQYYTNDLYVASLTLSNYSSNLTDNEFVSTPAKKLVEITEELRSKKGNMSVHYCQQKLEIIQTISTSIQQVAANKGR